MEVRDNNGWKQASLIIAPLMVILLLSGCGSINPQNPSVGTIQSPSAGQTGGGNTSPPAIQPTLTVNSLSTPTSTATSLPTPGTVLCQPKAGDWPQTSDWEAVNAEYVNKDGNATPIIAPCDISVSDYAVEAKIRTSRNDYFDATMGVLARVNPETGAGYKGGISYTTFCGENCGQAELYDLLNSQHNTAQIGSLYTNTVYTVKLQVKGTDVTLYVNKNLVLEQHYTSANDAGKVGVECDQVCEVLQFTVVAV